MNKEEEFENEYLFFKSDKLFIGIITSLENDKILRELLNQLNEEIYRYYTSVYQELSKDFEIVKGYYNQKLIKDEDFKESWTQINSKFSNCYTKIQNLIRKFDSVVFNN